MSKRRVIVPSRPIHIVKPVHGGPARPGGGFGHTRPGNTDSPWKPARPIGGC